jgi:peptidoglycan/xylan/chitin deacetylase (PgdA/CDA1 family)
MLMIVFATTVPTRTPSTLANAGLRADAAQGSKLIALTFDDGPKPFVLMGTSTGKGLSSKSLLKLLDQQNVKATFFVMGWRLSKNADAKCRQDDGGVCREAAEEEHRRGHEIENHTFGHGDFRLMVKRYGEDWVLNDIDKASTAIQSITGVKPSCLRPPDWTIRPELEKKIEARGYHVMTRSRDVPPAMRDVDSEDYFCAGRSLAKFCATSPSVSDRVFSSTSWYFTSCRSRSNCFRGSFLSSRRVGTGLLRSVHTCRLLDDLARPPVAHGPEGAPGTLLTLGEVLAFLVRTSDNPVSHDDRLHAPILNEFQDCL